MKKDNYKNKLYYTYTKFVGAGFSFSVFMLFYVLFSSVNLLELSDALGTPLLWLAFYGYGILCSLIIDCIGKAFPRIKRWTILLYIVAGFVLFIFLMVYWVYIIIAGTIGLIAALLLYVGVEYISKSKWFAFIFTYFDGEHRIPIKLKKGEELSYTVDFLTDDGYGYYLANAKGKGLGLEEKGDTFVFDVKEDGEYYIVIAGNRAVGRVVVDWDIKNK